MSSGGLINVVNSSYMHLASECFPLQMLSSVCLFADSAADTRHVQILNRSNRELSFELSWPAHCLTITPQHGVIEPQYETCI